MNREPVLVDTSAWITGFKKGGPHQVKEFLRTAILEGLAVTCPPVVLELVQGCRTQPERDALQTRLESLRIVTITQDVWDRSCDLGFSLRQRGVTVPAMDLVVAAASIEHRLLLLHNDRHYEFVARHEPRLRTKTFLQPPGST